MKGNGRTIVLAVFLPKRSTGQIAGQSHYSHFKGNQLFARQPLCVPVVECHLVKDVIHLRESVRERGTGDRDDPWMPNAIKTVSPASLTPSSCSCHTHFLRSTSCYDCSPTSWSRPAHEQPFRSPSLVDPSKNQRLARFGNNKGR